MIEELHVTRVIGAPPQACHDLIAAVEAYPDWARDLKEVTVLARDDEGRASRVEFRVAAMGRSATYTLDYVHSDAPERLAWTLVEGDIVRHLDGEYTFDAVDDAPDQTEVTYRLAVELAIPLPGFVKRRAEGRIMHAALDDLQSRLES